MILIRWAVCDGDHAVSGTTVTSARPKWVSASLVVAVFVAAPARLVLRRVDLLRSAQAHPGFARRFAVSLGRLRRLTPLPVVTRPSTHCEAPSSSAVDLPSGAIASA